MYGLQTPASLHILCVLKRSGTYSNESGSLCTASLHISCVLKRSGISIIRRGVICKGIILFIPLGLGESYILWAEKKRFIPAYTGHFKVVIYRCINVSGSQKMIIWCPQANVLYDIFITYLCMRMVQMTVSD